MHIERRFVNCQLSHVELEERAGESIRFTGYAARFYDGTPDTEYTLFEERDADGKMIRAVERILPGAFDRALRDGDDIRLLYNHDPSVLLARTSSGTLKLATFSDGLRYTAVAPDTQASRDLQSLIKRKDITGSSFSFTLAAGDDNWTNDKSNGLAIRSITNFARVYDVGPVTFPAYTGTSAGIRMQSSDNCEARFSFDAWRRQRKQQHVARTIACLRALEY